MFERLGLRHVDRNALVVIRLGLRQQRQRLRVQAAGVEGEQRDRRRVLGDQVGEHHVFEAETGRECSGRLRCGLPEQCDAVFDVAHESS